MIGWATKLTLAKIAPFAIIALTFALGVSHLWAYGSGVTRERDRQESALRALEQQALARQEALADELEQAQRQRRIVTRETVRYVDRAPDTTGCLDAPVLDDRMFSALGGAGDAPR